MSPLASGLFTAEVFKIRRTLVGSEVGAGQRAACRRQCPARIGIFRPGGRAEQGDDHAR
jgi:hypothetical protein